MGGSHPRRWPTRAGTVRVRATVAAALIVGVALAAGGIGLVWLLHRSQTSSIEAAARLRATDVASLLATGSLPSDLAAPADDVTVVQVVDSQGRIVASSGNISGEGRIATFVPGGTQPVARNVSLPAVDNGHAFRVVALRASSPQGAVIVYAASSLAIVDSTTRSVAAALAFGLPVLVALVAATTWLLVGRALRPVENIRAEVAEISGHDLGRRVPEPSSHDEIGRLARTMNNMLERLDTAAERQRRFVADASHELRSPLASLRAQLEVGRAHPAQTDWMLTSDESLTEIDRMESLIRDLLTLARADAGVPPVRAGPLDFAGLAGAEAERVRSRDRVAVDTSGIADARVVGDADQLRQVLRNLLDNAERHAASLVTVAVQCRPGEVELTVRDDGTGIPLEARERVFERFTRLDDARDRDEGGSGLGLAIAREIITGHGGTIAVADVVGGAQIVVRLPRAGRA